MKGRFVLKIPDYEPVEIEGFAEKSPDDRAFAIAHAVASRMGLCAGLDFLVVHHMERVQNAPLLDALRYEAEWPHRRHAFVQSSIASGFVFHEHDRAYVEAQS